MTASALPSPVALDFTAAREWPGRAAADILGLGLFIAILVALPTAPTDLDRHQLPKETVVHLATWLAFVLARPWPPRGLRPAAGWAIAILLAAAAASALHAQNGWLAFRALALMVTGAVALLTARHLAGLGYARRLLTWCAVGGVAGAATALAQTYGASSVLFATTRVPGGTFGNRNFMAHIAALTLPLLLFGALAGRMRTALLGMAGTAVVTAAIVLSRSRAAWIGAGAGMVVLATALLMVRRRRALIPIAPWRIGTTTVMAVLGVVAALAIPNRLAWRSQSPYADTLTGLTAYDAGSGHGRLLQYANTARLIGRHPILGVGPGNWALRYGDVAPLNDPSWVWGDVIPLNPWPSSDWFALVSECGAIAGLATLLLAIALGWRAITALRTHGDRVIGGAALLASLTTLVVVGSFDAVLLLPIGCLFVALSTGALLDVSDGGAAVAPVHNVAAPPMTAAVAVLLGLFTLRSTLQTTAYVVAGTGRSLRRLTWAARLDPGSYPIRIALAQRLDCRDARVDIIAALHLAPDWPASELAARRCGIRRAR